MLTCTPTFCRTIQSKAKLFIIETNIRAAVLVRCLGARSTLIAWPHSTPVEA